MGTLSDTVANNILNAACRNVSFAIGAVWIQVHLGDPGAAGTSNLATNTTRKQATFGNAAAGRTIAITAADQWVGVPATETYLWVSAWDASSSGNFIGRSGPFPGGAVNAGDTWTLPIGNLTFTVI